MKLNFPGELLNARKPGTNVRRRERLANKTHWKKGPGVANARCFFRQGENWGGKKQGRRERKESAGGGAKPGIAGCAWSKEKAKVSNEGLRQAESYETKRGGIETRGTKREAKKNRKKRTRGRLGRGGKRTQSDLIPSATHKEDKPHQTKTQADLYLKTHGGDGGGREPTGSSMWRSIRNAGDRRDHSSSRRGQQKKLKHCAGSLQGGGEKASGHAELASRIKKGGEGNRFGGGIASKLQEERKTREQGQISRQGEIGVLSQTSLKRPCASKSKKRGRKKSRKEQWPTAARSGRMGGGSCMSPASEAGGLRVIGKPVNARGEVPHEPGRKGGMVTGLDQRFRQRECGRAEGKQERQP